MSDCPPAMMVSRAGYVKRARGFPPAAAAKAKSFVSCAMGRMS
jgi:hypothetical protein